MEKIDGRKIGDEANTERRIIIMRMKDAGFSEKEIIDATGCYRGVIYNIQSIVNKTKKTRKRKTDMDETNSVLQVKKRGIKFGEHRTLTPKQEKHIQKLITDKYPDQLKFDFALWTREAVMKLIKKECGITMPIRTVGEYLKRWGWTPQKPVKYAYERDPEKVEKWVNKEYMHIKTRAKKEKADIFWGDETTIKAGDVRGRGYAPRGKTPVVNRTEKKENVSMISAITNKGKVFWKLHDGSINAARVLNFLKRLVKSNGGRKVFMILDNARTHHSKIVSEWLKENSDKIEIFYLPPYSPDLNPDEHLNADIKYRVGSKKPKRTKDELRKTASAQMRIIKSHPEKIEKYFDDVAIQYAA